MSFDADQSRERGQDRPFKGHSTLEAALPWALLWSGWLKMGWEGNKTKFAFVLTSHRYQEVVFLKKGIRYSYSDSGPVSVEVVQAGNYNRIIQ